MKEKKVEGEFEGEYSGTSFGERKILGMGGVVEGGGGIKYNMHLSSSWKLKKEMVSEKNLGWKVVGGGGGESLG